MSLHTVNTELSLDKTTVSNLLMGQVKCLHETGVFASYGERDMGIMEKLVGYLSTLT